MVNTNAVWSAEFRYWHDVRQLMQQLNRQAKATDMLCGVALAYGRGTQAWMLAYSYATDCLQ